MSFGLVAQAGRHCRYMKKMPPWHDGCGPRALLSIFTAVQAVLKRFELLLLDVVWLWLSLHNE